MAKPGFYICPLILFALFVYGLFQSPVEYDSYYDSLDMQLDYLYPFLVLLPIFTCVYGDELKSGTMITAIGRGLSRTKVILAKFIDTLVLSLSFCLFFLLMDQITFSRFSVVLTKVQELRILSAGDASSEAEVTVREGKFHQVKRMFGAIDHEVLTLHRCSFGPLELDPGLQPGQWRELTEEEMKALRNAAKMNGDRV